MKILKTSAQKCGLWSVIFALSAFAASAANVTYQVNMSVQKNLGNFIPANSDTVMVAGDFNSWATSNYVLKVSADINVYTNTFSTGSLAVGANNNYKFIINPNGNSTGTSLKWESINNRFYAVPATDTNLPVVYFNGATNAAAVSAITFQVDMSVQMALTNFNATAGDLVYVSGEFNSWSASANQLTQSLVNTNIWAAAITLTNSVGATVNYKFLYVPFNGSGTVWEGNVGTNGGQNRQFSFPSTASNLPPVLFNNVSNGPSHSIIFQLNLSVPDAFGTNFTPGVDTVYVAGDWNFNGNANQLMPTANPDVYTGTVAMVFGAGTFVNYKYNLNAGNTWEGNVGPNNSLNRQFVMQSVTTNLPMDYFNNLTNLGPLSVSNVSGGQAKLMWNAGTHILLQNAASLTGGWSNVTNTLGSNSATVNITGQKFFRLVGPTNGP